MTASTSSPPSRVGALHDAMRTSSTLVNSPTTTATGAGPTSAGSRGPSNGGSGVGGGGGVSSFEPLTRTASSRLPTTEGLLAHVSGRGAQAMEQQKQDDSAHRENGQDFATVTKRGGGVVRGVDESDEKAWQDEEAQVEDGWIVPNGGKAWLVVAACFVYSGCQMGYGLTWGIWNLSLSKQHPTTSIATINLVVGLSNFLMASTSYVAGRFGDIWGYRPVIAIGAALFTISLFISAFVSHHLPLLFIFQGACVGISGGLGMPLYMSLPSQWFSSRRGLATGIATAGSGIGGGIAAMIIRGLLPRLEYRNAMLCYAGINGFCLAVTFPLLKENLPPKNESDDAPGRRRKVPKQWLPSGIWSNGSFWSLCGAVFVGVFGFLTPYYYITTYTSVKQPQLRGLAPAVPLILSNFLSGLGRIFSGQLADRIGAVNCFLISFTLAGLLQVAFWPFADSYATIIIFMCLEGFIGSWFFSLIPGCAVTLFKVEGQGLATIVGFLVLVNSPGQFAGASISGLVLNASGGDYRTVAWYAGSCMIVGACCLLYARFRNEKRIWAKL